MRLISRNLKNILKVTKPIWTLIVIIVLVLIWWFFIRTSSFLGEPQVTPTPSLGQQEMNLLNQDEADDISSIEKDLNNTDLNNLDKELSDIEKEL